MVKKKHPDDKPTVTLRMATDLRKQIDAEADKNKLTRSEMMILLLKEGLNEMHREMPSPYKLLQDNHIVVIFDPYREELAVVYIEEDIDEQLHFSCDIDVGQSSCDHIFFVRRIPVISQWIKEAEEELGDSQGESNPTE